MQIPLEITYRDVQKSDSIENLIREKAGKLEQVCDYITRCSIAVERPNSSVKRGNPFRVRLDITVPPGHEIVVRRENGNGSKDEPLFSVIRDAFDTARRRLQDLTEKQRSDVKVHPEQETTAIIDRIFYDEGYGFIRTINGRDVYFHKNSVVNSDFENLETGTGVRFFEEDGDKGPQASTVHIIENLR